MNCARYSCLCALVLAAASPARASVILFDDFDPDITAGNFVDLQGGAAAGTGEGGFLDGNALYFGDFPMGLRTVTTAALDLSQGGTVEFAFRGGNEDVDGTLFWENSETSAEWVDLAYSTDGVTFVNFFELNTEADIGENPTIWNLFSIAIPDAAESATTSFRWTQRFNNGANNDNWALDNLRISNVPEPSSMALLGLGVAGSAWMARRRRRENPAAKTF